MTITIHHAPASRRAEIVVNDRFRRECEVSEVCGDVGLLLCSRCEPAGLGEFHRLDWVEVADKEEVRS